jgi:hypothetical protein
MRLHWIWFAAILALAAPVMAQTPGEIGVTYDWMHANAPVAECGCFSLNGGGVEAAWKLDERFALAAEAGAARASGQDLTLASYLAGPRLHLLSDKKSRGTRMDPYAQMLLGGAHAGGPLAGVISRSSNSFALRVGGGLNLRLNESWSVRLFEVDYLLTLLPNGVNDHQNIVLVNGGLLFRFGKGNRGSHLVPVP